MCNKDFTKKKNLRRHKQNVHNLIVSCDIIRNNIEAKHSCPACDLKFVQRSSLRRHERKVHKMNISATLRIKK